MNISSCVIISLGKEGLAALFLLSSHVAVSILCRILPVPWIGL